MSESAKWYVIHTYSGYENKVAQTIMKIVENRNLHHLIEDVHVPTEAVMEMNDKNQMREVERKILPGYVLVKMVITDAAAAAEKAEAAAEAAAATGDTDAAAAAKAAAETAAAAAAEEAAAWYVVRNVRGCTGFVGPGSKPVPLTDKEAAAFGVSAEKDADKKLAAVEVNYKAGDKIKIVAGKMEGWNGVVESVDTESMTVNVKVSMFGRDTTAVLDLTMVAASDEY